MMHELEYHDSAVFVTLTYDDEQLPADGAISRRELQLFFKRLRKFSGRYLRYFACGEYGGTTGRPHYHAIIYGLKLCGECRCCSKWARRGFKEPDPGCDCALLEKAWPLGYVHVGDVTGGSVRYVADYLQKNAGEFDYGGRAPAFSLMSRGLGKQWLMDHLDEVSQTLQVRGLKNQWILLPKYYQRKLVDLHSGDMFDFSCYMKSVAARRGMTRDRDVMEWIDKRYDPVRHGVGWRLLLKQHNNNLGAKRRIKENRV
jgi:hypothetical protein